MANPKDKNLEDQAAEPLRSDVRGMEAPDGIDLHPEPRKVVRISRRAGLAIVLVVVGLLFAFAYGGYRRTQRTQAAARDAGLPRNVGPATQASGEFIKSIPDGTAPFSRKEFSELRPPDTAGHDRQRASAGCGSNPQTGQAYRFNPQTGQPCDGLPQERLVIRQAPVMRTQSPAPVITPHEPTPEERRLAAAYAREQEARMAPTSIRAASSAAEFAPSPAAGRNGGNDLAQVAALTQALGSRTGENAAGTMNALPSTAENEYDGQNMQSRKEAFLNQARTRQREDYLNRGANRAAVAVRDQGGMGNSRSARTESEF